ncbi:PREDICTED: cytochrome P450 4c3-like [Polistes canadensis]|uniref:cytochrome P450 4c3-like n=1 Tax=Polistes canadensis TaxID=91411 RepID=UPI000718C3A8|nr:PREDICTED: cytochrome P450 4c3-like [Polistes canadensis]
MPSAIQTFFDYSWITLILSFFLLLMVTVFAIQHGQFIYAVRKIPHPISLPLIGNAYQLNCTLEEFFSNLIEWSNRFGDIFLVWVGIRPFIFLYKVETVQPLLSSRVHINKSFEYGYLIPWLGNGLITSNGKRWHHRRKLLTPTFHYSNLLEDYFSSAINEAKIMIDCLKGEIGKSVDIVPYAKRAALDVICDSSMGYRINAQTNLFNEYVLAVDKLSQIAQHRFTSVWTSIDFIFKLTKLAKEHDRALKIVHNFIDKVIAERKQEWNNNRDKNCNKPTKKHQALLDLLLEISNNLTDTDIRDEVNTFMFAGHDTTATSISWILYALGRRPEYQQQILDEYDEIIGSDEMTSETLNKLVLLDACIKESWRLYPVAPLIARQIYSPLEILGHTIPAGSTVLINSYLLHRDARHFPEPHVYKPERFLPCNPRPPRYTYVPFSEGLRNCIGKKFATVVVKVFILSILKAYHIESLITEDKLRLKAELVLVNKDGLPLKITPRTR